MADEIINARVKQKVDTEANWLANPLILLEGEQGFVWDGFNDPVNFKIGDGTKTFAELPYFIAYYSDVVSHKIIRLPNISSQQTIPSIFNQNTNLYDIVITNTGGSSTTINIGLTSGGSEIGSFPIGQGNTVLDLKYQFDSQSTLYLSGFDGNSISVIIIYFNYAELPAAPPTAGVAPKFRWPKNHLGMFMSTGTGSLEAAFDMITGLGVVGSAYENCQICDPNNPYLDMSDSYPIGYKTGVSLGAVIGSNSFTITKQNLPDYKIEFPIWGIVFQRGSSGTSFRWITGIGDNNKTQATNGSNASGSGYQDTAGINLGGSSSPIDNRPKSRYVLYYLAITD